MADILHRVGARGSSPEAAYRALTTLDGLSGWWAEKVSGEPTLGGTLEFSFGLGGIDMRVVELEPGRRVRWDVAAGPQEWLGTSVQFDLRPEGDWTIVLFRHDGWREPVEFMHHCTTKWGSFLLSLKQLLETGTGAPEPRDLQISDWH